MKKFREDQHTEFANYINKLQGRQRRDPNKPYACEELVTLPEGIIYGNRGITFEEGTRVCRIGASQKVGKARCAVKSDLQIDDKGIFEIQCERNGSIFRAQLKEFSPQRKSLEPIILDYSQQE